MARGKYDYAALEAEFIQTDVSVSVRAFAKEHGIPWSALNAQVNKPDSSGRTWREKREAFHARATEKAIERAGDEIAEKITVIRKDALDIIHAAILKMGFDMQDRVITRTDSHGNPYQETIPGQVVTPSDFVKIIDKLLLMTGQPTTIGEERRHVEQFNFDGLPPELTRIIADVARERTAQSRPVERPRLPGSGSAGPN